MNGNDRHITAIMKDIKTIDHWAGYLEHVNPEELQVWGEALYKAFMRVMGIREDDNSRETPERVTRMFIEKTGGLRNEPPKIKTFPSDGYDEYVAIKDIPYYSICSHHHVPFYGKAHICYWPDKLVAGLSKFARVVTHFANKPQIQEGMTKEITEYLFNTLKPKGIFVRVEGIHLCMTSRGAKAEGSSTVTQKMMGSIDVPESLSMLKE